MGMKIDSFALPLAAVFAVMAVLAGAFGLVLTGMILDAESEMHEYAVRTGDAEAAANADRVRARADLLACVSRSIQILLVVIGAAAFIFLIVISLMPSRPKTVTQPGDALDSQFERY